MHDAMPMTSKDTGADKNCLPKGTRLAEFKILGVIGEGGFGIVYFAVDNSLRRVVAIKEYIPGAFAERGPNKKVIVRSEGHKEIFDIGLKNFINEARLLAQFDHPALIKVYRFWEQNNTGYMAMRYYEGRTLKSVINNTPMLVTEVWLKSILKPMLEALDAMYRVQLLHRDISPDNIMIQKNGEAVLLDFGAARQIIVDMTQSLTVILKPGYAPIEQYAEDESMKQGPWTDIYSLSAVMYFAIEKKSPPVSVARMIKDPLEPLRREKYSSFSQEFLDAINAGLSLMPQDRPQSIDAFRRLLGLELSVPMPTQNNDTVIHLSEVLRNRKQGESHAVSPVAPIESKQPNMHAARAKELQQPRKFKLSMMLSIAVVVGVLSISGYTLFKRATVALSLPQSEVLITSPAKPVPAPVVITAAASSVVPIEPISDEESIAWEALNQQATLEQVDAFIQKYPVGKYVEMARAKRAEMESKDSVNQIDLKSSVEAATDVVPVPATSSDITTIKPTAVVTLTIKPWGHIWVDGIMKGVSPPLKKMSLPEGKHQIKVVNPHFPDYVVDINVMKKKPGNIDYDFSSTEEK